MRLRKVAFSLLALLLLGGLVMAQAVNAKLEGVVSDNEGGPLPGVTVMASSPTMVGTASTVTDENGKYRLLGITPGTYKITFALEGFTTITKENIILHVEETLAVNVKMKLGQLSEEIVVTAQVPLIDTKSTSRGGVLTTATVRDATHWDDLVKSLGFGNLTRHGLRHTGATWMADAGIALHVLQEILGHQSIETTKGYLHPDHRHLAEAARQANQFLSAAPTRRDPARRDGLHL